MEVQASIGGKLLKILVAEGAAVAEDDEMFVIEVMKMETQVYAPCSGTVSGIKVNEGDRVEEGQVLASVD